MKIYETEEFKSLSDVFNVLHSNVMTIYNKYAQKTDIKLVMSHFLKDVNELESEYIHIKDVEEAQQDI